MPSSATPASAPQPLRRWQQASAATRLSAAVAIGLVVGAVAALLNEARYALTIGWDAASVTFLAATWSSLWRLDAAATRRLATREDASRRTSDVVLVSAAVASLASVGLVLFGASQARGAAEIARVGLGIGSVALSWAVVHTVFCLRYARLYYGDPPGGIDFNSATPPTYPDFAYLAFTVGMTFQVSDTEIADPRIRATVLRHALISFLFGTVIISVTVNLVAGLSANH